MDPLDNLPTRHTSHDIADAAEAAFVAEVERYRLFLVQQKDRNDYGADVQIEARQDQSVTNLRVHVQLKGTSSEANSDGTVSIQVTRANLNYLLAQSDSIYVCYDLHTRRLLVRYADDVYREYEHRSPAWGEQATVTVKFSQVFDENFQRTLHARVLASGKSARNQRLKWTATPPDRIAAMVRGAVPSIEVPANPEQARDMLSNLYDDGFDSVISNSFERFAAVLGNIPGAMDKAYMAEFNLGINHLPFNADRVRSGIQALEDSLRSGKFFPGSILYCQGNGWLALGEYERARDLYNAALFQLDHPALVGVAAQCSKNMGSALEALGHQDAARAFYERALDLDPDLGEAHFALGLWHYHHGNDPQLALEHLDYVIRQEGSTLPMSGVRGWRIDLLFKAGEVAGAFREINFLLSEGGHIDWAWPWCARKVADFGRVSVDSAQRAVRFWQSYLRKHAGDSNGERELMLCRWYLHQLGVFPGVDFEEFRRSAIRVMDREGSQDAFLWDRVGHWAQHDGDWPQAEEAYRKAYDLEPEQYGYCLGTALNFLSKFIEALPILIREATEFKKDAMSWFQVAIAKEGLGDFDGAIEAYRTALELDADYDLAWFNLGGIFWNLRDPERAISVWSEALARFPEHALSAKIRNDFFPLFETGEGESD